jgi:pimeloyl-ACP methyl ester carboxylesterase
MPQLAGVRHRTVGVDGLRVHVAEAGEGPPLVLLHGWPQHWWCWHRVVPLLQDTYRLVVPDLRGHGWTDAPPDGYDKEQLATDLLGLLDALELPRVGLVGHDWGGWTSFLAALRAPERFSALLALGIVHPFQRPTLGRALASWRLGYQVALATPVLAERALRASPALVEQVVRAGSVRRGVFAGGGARTYGEVLQEPARARASSRLYREFVLREAPPVALGRYRGRRLTVPTRLVVGDGDAVAVPALLEGWQSAADDMTVEVLPGVGHFVPEEAPEEVATRARALFR